MRIIAGKHKGRKLNDCYKLKDLRPTTDRNKESLFNILTSAKFLKDLDFDLTKRHLLDVFSGSGAISFEALSRGVKSVTLIEKNSNHLELSKQNAKILGEEKNCEFINFDISKPIFKSHKQYDLIFIDPPYQSNLLEVSIQNLINANFIAKNAIIIFEYSVYEKLDLEKLQNLEFLADRKYSKTIFSYFRKV